MIIGKKVLKFPTLDSTNDESKRLIRLKKGIGPGLGVGEGTVVIAETQTKGRGKPGSEWVSPKGGLYLSVILKPYKNPRDLAPITLLAAEAVVESVGMKAEIKLPNDVLINGKKVCGILVERVASGHLIVGIGINVNNALPEELNDLAASLKFESGKEIDLDAFLEDLLAALDRRYLAYLG